MNYTELSLEKLREVSIDVAKIISAERKIDLIIYVARAGLPIAVYMNEIFSVEMLGISAQRKGNSFKSKLGPLVAYCPRFVRDMLITIELKSKVHKKDTQRNVQFHEFIKKLDVKKYKNILIVDDSVDTGNSMKLVYDTVKNKFYTSNILTYSLNVWDESKTIFSTDYCSYENCVIKAPMSKDSREYKKFCEMYVECTQDDYI